MKTVEAIWKQDINSRTFVIPKVEMQKAAKQLIGVPVRDKNGKQIGTVTDARVGRSGDICYSIKLVEEVQAK